MVSVLEGRIVRTFPELENGDHLDQPTFHERYCAASERMRAELIQGVVFLRSRQRRVYSQLQIEAIAWLGHYETETPGVELLTNTTQILGPTSEPEPDAALIILPELGGQTHENDDGFMVGPPELAVEISA